MAKAKKLPSGQWRTLVYDCVDDKGKRHYESFTAGTKKESEYLAAEFALNKKDKKNVSRITFGDAFDSYIESRSSVLSPATIREYKRTRRCHMQELMSICICDITQDIVQRIINAESEAHAPKTIRNMHGLLSAVLKVYRPDFALATSLPQRIPPNLYIPTDSDVKTLLEHVGDPDMEIAVLLSAFGPLRRSEICALDSTHLTGNVIHVQRAMVMDENKRWVYKNTKSYAGDRYIPLPDFIFNLIKNINGKIIRFTPSQVSDRFIDIQNASGLPHFRFHDLRHYCASIQHAIGIPDAYIMQRGGWGSDAVLKTVYRHALSDKELQMNDIANNHFDSICNTKSNTQKNNP